MVLTVPTMYQVLNCIHSRTLYLGGKHIELSDNFYINRNNKFCRVYYNHNKVADLDISGGTLQSYVNYNEVLFQKMRNEIHDGGYIL